jgi:acyl dehydratase
MTENRSSDLTSLGINVGARTQQANTVTETEADIVRFAEVPGDFNPAHICSDFVKKTLLGAELPVGCWSRDQYARLSLNCWGGKNVRESRS